MFQRNKPEIDRFISDAADVDYSFSELDAPQPISETTIDNSDVDYSFSELDTPTPIFALSLRLNDDTSYLLKDRTPYLLQQDNNARANYNFSALTIVLPINENASDAGLAEYDFKTLTCQIILPFPRSESDTGNATYGFSALSN